MPAYIVVEIDVVDHERFETYRQIVPASVAAYGGKYLVRGGKVQTLEGTWTPKRFVVLEFPSVERAKAWYNSPEYAEARALRQECARSQIIVAEGL